MAPGLNELNSPVMVELMAARARVFSKLDSTSFSFLPSMMASANAVDTAEPNVS